MSIGELRDLLRESRVLQEIGHEPTPGELADVLWLAMLNRGLSRAKASGRQFPVAEPPDVSPVSAAANVVVPPVLPPGFQSPRATVLSHVRVEDVRLRVAEPATASSTRRVAVQVTASPQLLDPLRLGRALRPLRRQIASAGREILDEAATADLGAEQRMWLPMLTPAKEPAFDLALVIDASDSMALWNALIREFRLLCEQLGAFRDIRTWYLTAGRDSGHPVPTLHGASPVSGARDPHELLDPSGRRLIVVITDGVHPWWQPSGLLQPILGGWAAANSVAIIQPFPQRLWNRSMLRPAVAEFRANGPGRSMAHLIRSPYGLAIDTTPDPDSDTSATIIVPILELTPTALHRWARLTAGSGLSVTLAAAILSRRPEPSDREDQPGSLADPDPVDPARLVRDFRASVSTSAYRLAGYLSSAAPLTLPVMRLVQQSMMPESGPAELAEVFLGGLIRRLSAETSDEDRDSVTYGFVAGVREILFSTITRAEALSVQDQVGNHLVSGQRAGRPFSVFAEGLTDEDARAAAERYPSSFGRIRRMLLERIGGPYAEAAQQAWAVNRAESEGWHAPGKLQFRQITGVLVEAEAQVGDAELSAGEFLTARKVRLEDGTELRQHKPASGSQRRGYDRLDNEILAGRRVYEVAAWKSYPPEVTRLYGYEATSADPYALFEPYRGQPLREVGASFLDEESDIFMAGLLTGLCWLGAAGLAHRAINPDTVLWDSQQRRVQITDFSQSTVFGVPRTPVAGPSEWVSREQRPGMFYGTVGPRDDIWAACRLIFFVRNQGEHLLDRGQIARSGLDLLFDGMFDQVFGPPEGRPTARELLEQGLKRRNPAPRAAGGSAGLIAGRERFLVARQRKHPGAPVPPEFNEDIDWTVDLAVPRPSAQRNEDTSAATSATGETARSTRFQWIRGE